MTFVWYTALALAMRTCVEISKHNTESSAHAIFQPKISGQPQNELVLAKYVFSEGVKMKRRKGNTM